MAAILNDIKIDSRVLADEMDMDSETSATTSQSSSTTSITSHELLFNRHHQINANGERAAISSELSQCFRALGKIVNFLRKHFLNGNLKKSLTLTEILDATKQNGLKFAIRKWLRSHGLPNHNRIKVTDNVLMGARYQYKPIFELKDANDLIELLSERERLGMGGISLDDLRESLPNCNEIMKECKGRIAVLTRTFDRKKIVIYGRPIDEGDFEEDFEVNQSWFSFGLDAIEEASEDQPIEQELSGF